MIKLKPIAGLLALLSCTASAVADVSVPQFFSDNMVLQRGEAVPVWGKADPGEAVTVAFAGQSKKAEADKDGKWMVKLDAMDANAEGATLTVSGKNKLEIENVLVGEVWICSGQSNMQWTVSRSMNPDEEAAAAKYPKIRMYLTDLKTAAERQDDASGTWYECNPENAPNFSAVGYYFGRELHKQLDIPVGLIRTAWGGTRSEAWTSPEALAADPSAKELLAGWNELQKNYDSAKAKEQYEAAVKRWEDQVAKIKEFNKTAKNKKRLPRKPQLRSEPRVDRHHPSAIYNAMIAPFEGFGIRGAIWYQGESNRQRAAQYRDIFPTMIEDWRARWNKEFPFYFVQLANFLEASTEPGVPDSWAELQEAQFLTLKRLPHTGMAVANDIGAAKDIHPKNKQEVGRRLALWALANDYGKKDLVHSGPLYSGHEIQGSKVKISFDHVGKGLKSRDGGDLKRFEIAGEDKKWHWADAKIDGDSVIVSSADVTKPVAVRYAWAANPTGANLVNSDDLPASLFRTDDWPGLTDDVMTPFAPK